MVTRVERRAAYQRHIEAAEAKGQSLSRYAREQGLSPKTLYRHRRRLREEQASNNITPFVRVDPPARAMPMSGLQARLPNGVVVALPAEHPALPAILEQLARL